MIIIVPLEEAGGGGAGCETNNTRQQYLFLPVTQVVPIIIFLRQLYSNLALLECTHCIDILTISNMGAIHCDLSFLTCSTAKGSGSGPITIRIGFNHLMIKNTNYNKKLNKIVKLIKLPRDKGR